ncbi:MAG: hypothetical protein A2096_11735 [Spirochaetes bacterium GWF1_41_5]|nr:MAG: hypothetical protein A2096_11735 [Spirochaetes bacterium GWF1_41_5]HBE02762.1 hypothetical protein [Spirochaetia bacterium]
MKKILIIDDDQDLLDSLSMAVEAKGFQPLTAGSAAEGLKKISSEKPDLLVCDIMMEDIDAGLKLAEQLTKTNPELPKIGISNIAETTRDTIDISRYGYKYFLQKPVDPDKLVSLIRSIIGN